MISRSNTFQYSCELATSLQGQKYQLAYDHQLKRQSNPSKHLYCLLEMLLSPSRVQHLLWSVGFFLSTVHQVIYIIILAPFRERFLSLQICLSPIILYNGLTVESTNHDNTWDFKGNTERKFCFCWVQPLISTNINLLKVSFDSKLTVSTYIKIEHTGVERGEGKPPICGYNQTYAVACLCN